MILHLVVHNDIIGQQPLNYRVGKDWHYAVVKSPMSWNLRAVAVELIFGAMFSLYTSIHQN